MNILWSNRVILKVAFELEVAFTPLNDFPWKDKSLLILNLFISEYLDQFYLWKEMKQVARISQIKDKMQSSNTLIRISGPIPEL